MAPSLGNRSGAYSNIGALSQLVEAASALTELEVKQGPVELSKPTVLVSDDDEVAKATVRGRESTTSASGTKKKEIFPQKLMEILADSSLSDIVSWLPHGRSFVIIRPDLFCEQVLPRYLPPADSRGSTKYASFTRKLNRWGFRQATRGADTGAFHHPFFRRDQRDLCAKMVCQKSRDRQQNNQKHRSLPPKKRSVQEDSSSVYSNATKLLRSSASTTDPVISCSMNRSAHLAAPVSTDERSIGTSSTNSQTSSSNSLSFTHQNDRIGVAITHLSASTSSVANVTKNLHPLDLRLKSRGHSGIISLISNDPQFVALALKQRDSLEVYRAAKAMLYDAYVKAVTDETL